MKRDRKMIAALADDWQPRDRKRHKTKARDKARKAKAIRRKVECDQ